MAVLPIVWTVFVCCVGVAALGGWVASLLAVYDCARRDFDDPGARALWCVLIAISQGIGAIAYYFVVYRSDEPPIEFRRLHAPPPLPSSGPQ